MIEACGVCGQKIEAGRIFQDVKKDLEPSIDTINSYFQACAKATQVAKIESKVKPEEEKKIDGKYEQKIHEKLLTLIDKAVIELSTICKNPECDRYIKEEETLSAWPRSFDTYFIKCPTCGKDFIPTLDVQMSPDKSKSFYFLFPPLFKKEVNNLIDNKTSKVFFSVLHPIIIAGLL
jgi:hypothetical protein